MATTILRFIWFAPEICRGRVHLRGGAGGGARVPAQEPSQVGAAAGEHFLIRARSLGQAAQGFPKSEPLPHHTLVAKEESSSWSRVQHPTTRLPTHAPASAHNRCTTGRERREPGLSRSASRRSGGGGGAARRGQDGKFVRGGGGGGGRKRRREDFDEIEFEEEVEDEEEVEEEISGGCLTRL